MNALKFTLILISILFLPTLSNYLLAGNNTSSDSTKNFLKNGHFGIHLRSMSMYTYNAGSLNDYAAIATGAGLHYQSESNKMFQFGVSGFFIFRNYQYNLENSSHSLHENSSAGSRYELTMFDMHDPENASDLDRLEDLYLRFSKKRLEIIAGRQELETPFLNRQDNRMRPNVFQGITANYKLKSTLFTAAWLESVTPRGTVHWYNMSNSLGVYPFGRSIYGSTSEYKNNIETKGLFMFGVNHNYNDIKVQAWNYFTENVFNLIFAQADYSHNRVDLGVQGFYTTAVNNGGNAEPEKSYMLKGENTFGFGAKTGYWIDDKHELTFNFLYIDNNGRFLFPREWGREQFYANINRERFEGNGGLTSFAAGFAAKSIIKKDDILSLGASVVNSPDFSDYKLNKYGMPSYYHLLASYDLHFHGKLEGLYLRLICAGKVAMHNEIIPTEYLENRADMGNFTFMVDYKF